MQFAASAFAEALNELLSLNSKNRSCNCCHNEKSVTYSDSVHVEVCSARAACRYSNRNPLHLVEAQLVAPAIVKLRGARRGMVRQRSELVHGEESSSSSTSWPSCLRHALM